MKREQFVYFMKPVGQDGPVKIGCSERPNDRLSTFMTWSPIPLEIAATVPGDFALEKNIHECFADQHSHREWFHPSARLTKLIEDLANGVAIRTALDLSDRRGATRGATGGRAWPAHTRAYMSLFHQCRAAARRLGYANVYHVPQPVRAALSTASERELRPAEVRVITSFLAKSREAVTS